MEKLLLVTDHPSLPTGLARIGRELSPILNQNFDFEYLGLHSPSETEDFSYKVISDRCKTKSYGMERLSSIVNCSVKEKMRCPSGRLKKVLTIGDPFHFNYIPHLSNRRNFTWISYITVDSIDYTGRLPMSWQLSLCDPDMLVTTSLFGCDSVTNFLEITPRHIPLGVGNQFYRMDEEERSLLRESFGLKNYFVVAVVNRNTVRKQLPMVLKTAKILSKTKLEHYAGIKFFLYTNPNDMYGYDLEDMVKSYGINDLVLFSKLQDVKDEVLNKIYNLSDVFLTTSGGEGFGLTVLEAMKCGLPIVCANYSSLPELVGKNNECGTLLTPRSYLTTENGTELAILDPEDIAGSIIELSSNSSRYQSCSVKAMGFAERYPWDDMTKDMLDVLQLAEKKSFKEHKQEKELIVSKEKIVDLVVPEDVNWKPFTYAHIGQVFEIEWNSSKIQTAVMSSEKDWVALVASGVSVQRGWLCELMKLASEDVAIVASTCIDKAGKLVEGEIRHGASLIFFPEEGLSNSNNIDKEIASTVFSSVLINRKIFAEIGGFKTNLTKSYFDIEYCLRCRSEGYKILKSGKSLVLRQTSYDFNNEDGVEFRLETETRLNSPVHIQYKGTREKILTKYGILGKELVKFPYRVALDLVTSYREIDFVDVKRDVNILDHLVKNGGSALIARNMGLGDVFSALYFGARPLKIANPNIKLAVCVNKPYVEVIRWLPWVDEVFIYPDGISMAKDFDYFSDLSYIPETKDPKSQLPRPDIFAGAFLTKKLYNFEYEAFQVPQDRAREARKTFDDLGIGKDGRKVVGIQALCESPIRVYAPEYLSQLIKLLVEDFDVVLFGQDRYWRWGAKDWNGEHLFSFVDKTDDLDVVVPLMEMCDYGIAPDSGLMHIWAFMRKPTLALFGNIKPENRTKYYPTVVTLYPEGELSCIPCGDVYNPCPECSDLGAKGVFSGRCMRRLYPERVYLKFLEMVGFNKSTKTKIKIDRCPICNSQDFKVVNEIDFWDGGSIPKCIYVQCPNDGLVFVTSEIEPISYETSYFQSGSDELYYKDILSSENVKSQMSSAKRVLDEYHKRKRI